jgi:DNA-binding NarL/FixJ family response regulator
MRNSSLNVRQRARVLIADDYVPFAEKCRGVLEPEFEVVGVVSDASRLTRIVTELKPDVVLIDISMPRSNGFEVGDQVKATRPEAKTIYMTFASGFDLAAEAFRRGAAAFVIKVGFPGELLAAVRRVIRGEMYLSRPFLVEAAAIGGGYLPGGIQGVRRGGESHARRRGACSSTRRQ